MVLIGRDIVRRRLGDALGAKATDPLCAALAGDPDDERPTVVAVELTALEPPPALRGDLPAPHRRAAIDAERDRCHRDVPPVREVLERASTAPVALCWLNRTLRAQAPPRVLAELAADPAVERIDLPRPIRAEAIDATVRAAATLRAALEVTGAGIPVGIVDGEVDADHPAFQDRVMPARNYTHEPFGAPASHGTAVAGIVGARAPRFTGMAPGALLSNYKVLASFGVPAADDLAACMALQDALQDGMRVVNCSWGTGPATDGTSREARACDRAWSLGLTIVKASGNHGPGAGTLTTPADATGVLTVGASSTDGLRLPSYSSRGPTTDGRPRPHVLAPGGEPGAAIDTTLLGDATGDVAFTGTSYAAPHVTGLIALLLEREPALTPDQQRDRVVATAHALSGVPAAAQGGGLIAPASLF